MKDKVLIEIPHRTQTANDFAWLSRSLNSPIKAQRSLREAIEFFRDTFDGYIETVKKEEAQLFTFGIHPFTSCLPDRIRALDGMIAYMKGSPYVWVTSYISLANWWKKYYL